MDKTAVTVTKNVPRPHLQPLEQPQTNLPADDLFFVSVIPANPGDEAYTVDLLRGRYERTGIKKYAMSYPLHPQGEDLLAKARLYSTSFKKIKTLLGKDSPVELGILLQATIGHGGVWNRTPENSLKGQHILLENGEESARFCPYEQNFLDYITEAVALVAEGRPAFLLGDDDMRMAQNCFCPLHLQRLEALTGRKFTREELAGYLANARPHDPVSEKFTAVNREGIDALADAIRKGIDRVDPALRCGVCICLPRLDYAESQLKILGGGTPFVLRVSNSSYCENAIKTQTLVDLKTSYQCINYRKLGDFPLLDESDTCPHHRYSKSAATMNLHIVSGLLHGTSGGKLWFDQSIQPLPEIFEEYEAVFAQYSGFYKALHALMRRFTPDCPAARIPPFSAAPFLHNGQNFHDAADWGALMLGRMGIPAAYTDMTGEGITLLAGNQADHYTDGELRRILSGKVLLDGPAALLLTQRGFSDLTGVTASAEDFKANQEENTGIKLRTPFVTTGTPFFKAAPQAEVLSRAIIRSYSGAVPQEVMPASVCFRNSAGGEVISTAMNIKEWPAMYKNSPGRKYQLRYFFDRLGGLPAELTALQDAKLITGKLSDARRLWAVFNYSYDPLKTAFRTHLPIKKVSELLPSGEIQEISFTCAGGILSVDRPLPAAGFAVYILE